MDELDFKCVGTFTDPVLSVLILQGGVMTHFI